MNTQDTKLIYEKYSTTSLVNEGADHNTIESAAYFAIGYYKGGQGYMEGLDDAIRHACEYFGLDTRIDGPAVEQFIADEDPDTYTE